jgi:predicted CXXCH cytochrome family protein
VSTTKSFSIMKPILIVVLTGLLSMAAWGAIHPVPLDPKQDPATCAQCHQDKTKGKFVHSAIAMGCMTCHEIRVNRGTTRVKLVTPTPAHLCLTCHADKDAKTIKGRVHPPAVRDCIKCHDPHTSDNKFQLLKAESGDSAKNNLCLECHTIGVNVPKGGSRHPALDMGCDTCHTTHKTGQRGVREFDFHLTKDAPALCKDCHDVTDASLIKAHNGQPFGNADCLECHDPHQSDQPHLLAKYLHPPFAGGQCDTCHQPAKDGKVVLTAATPKAICVMCHSDKGDQIDKAKVPHPGAQMSDCTDCHSPHGGNFPDFVKPNPVAVCTGCHSDIGDLGKKAHPHAAAFGESAGCAVCHDPHGNDNKHLLRAKTPNALCLECHGPDSKPVKVPSEHVVTIFDGKVRLPENYFQQVSILPLKFGAGHPVADHPVSDLKDPNDPSKIAVKINCLTCHQPHASKEPNLMVGDQTYNAAFCKTCHKGLIPSSGSGRM